MTTNPKTRKAPADKGLPNLNAGGSILMETEHGLSVWRPLKSLKTSILPAESLDEFMSLLDQYVAFGDREDFIRHYWTKARGSSFCDEKFRAMAVEADADQKSARRDLIGHLKKYARRPPRPSMIFFSRPSFAPCLSRLRSNVTGP